MDPITLEVINSSLTAYADEMTNSFWRSSYSYFNYEIRDFAVGFIDRQGRIITQSRYTHPAFTGDLGYVVKAAVDTIGEDDIEEGDVIATNDPTVQGQHLNNVVVFSPLFVDGTIFAYSCVRAHLHDVGGSAIGSGSNTATEIFQEGLQISSVRIYRRGEPNKDVLRLIEMNSRFPELVLGDLNAQMASCKLGNRRLTELVKRFGVAQIQEAVQTSWDMAENAARKAIAKIKPGVYRAESFLDNDGISDTTVPIRVRVEVTDDSMTVDFSDIADQVPGAFNSGYYGGATNVARIAFKCLTSPHLPSTEGCFRPLTVVCPEGKILNARRPAALFAWSVIFPTVIDTIFKALSEAALGKVPAATRGDARGAGISGFDPHKRKFFSIHIPHPGGHGARPNNDGPAPKCSIQQGNEHSIPIEINEAKYPVVFERVALRDDSGGPGRYRGGLGTDVVVHTRLESAARNSMTRSKCLPWGLFDGKNGAGNEAYVWNGQGYAPMSSRIRYPLAVGQRIRVLTGGGGGYGNPLDRPAEKVADDVRNGYVTRESAEKHYGVICSIAGQLDQEATQAMRSRRSQERG